MFSHSNHNTLYILATNKPVWVSAISLSLALGHRRRFASLLPTGSNTPRDRRDKGKPQGPCGLYPRFSYTSVRCFHMPARQAGPAQLCSRRLRPRLTDGHILSLESESDATTMDEDEAQFYSFILMYYLNQQQFHRHNPTPRLCLCASYAGMH